MQHGQRSQCRSARIQHSERVRRSIRIGRGIRRRGHRGDQCRVDRNGLPETGYRLQGHHGNRYVYASGKYQVSLSRLPGTTNKNAAWVALLIYDCT